MASFQLFASEEADSGAENPFSGTAGQRTGSRCCCRIGWSIDERLDGKYHIVFGIFTSLLFSVLKETEK